MSSICHGFPPFPVAFEKTRRGRRSAPDEDGNSLLDRLKKPVMTLRYSLHDFRHAAASLRIEQRGKRKRPSVRPGGPGQRSLRSKGNWSAMVDPGQMASVLLPAQEHKLGPSEADGL